MRSPDNIDAANWSKITINLKELIGVIAFIFTVSGIYYKITYINDTQDSNFANYQKITDQRLKNLEDNQKEMSQLFKAQIQALNDFMISAKAIAEDHKEQGYKQLKASK